VKAFHCDHCQQLVSFENTRCVTCDHALAFLPDLQAVASLEPLPGAANAWRAAGDGRRTYRLCANYLTHNVCNEAIPAAEPHALCGSCRLTRVIPDLSLAANLPRWAKLEAAKRRLIYTLHAVGCPVVNKTDDPVNGLTFEFLADPATPDAPKVLTGHADGVVTLNTAEADDAERELRRVQLHEPARTLLGHFRHEVGHYYFDRLVKDTPRLGAFRELFGDERQDYAAALQRQYANGAPPDWQERHVSAYAASHPWEDWAETWAHYLNMVDTLETAAACGLTLKPKDAAMPKLKAVPADPAARPFGELIASWYPLTYALNSLSRGLGVPDVYPFVLAAPAVEKLRFVHETLAGQGAATQPARPADAPTPAEARVLS